MNNSSDRCLIVGAGPAGLTAAHEAQRLRIPAQVFEKDLVVGGISRTVEHQGYRFDIGGHRFFTKVPEIQTLWEEILGADLLRRRRLSRIYYQDRFFDYPIRPLGALRGLGPVESLRIGASWARAHVWPRRPETSFADWVSNRFGKRLYEIFFKTYTEKVWGMPCDEIAADWAAQRIKDLDLGVALREALRRKRAGAAGKQVTSLIEEFHYPRLGPGMLWERLRDRLEKLGTAVVLGAEVVRVMHDGRRVRGIVLRDGAGHEWEEAGTHLLSSMPIRELLACFDPAPPAHVLTAARRLRYRDFLTVALIVAREELFPDNWIYVHSPDVEVGRIQNFKNWSPEMVPDASMTSLGLEYFVQQGDVLWDADDQALVALARDECSRLGFFYASEVRDGVVVRMPKAYPVYDANYRSVLTTLRGWLDRFENLSLIGSNGQHRYSNQDHSMLTGLLAVRNIAGAEHDVWNVNVEPEYHEEARGSSGREAPLPVRVAS